VVFPAGRNDLFGVTHDELGAHGAAQPVVAIEEALAALDLTCDLPVLHRRLAEKRVTLELVRLVGQCSSDVRISLEIPSDARSSSGFGTGCDSAVLRRQRDSGLLLQWTAIGRRFRRIHGAVRRLMDLAASDHKEPQRTIDPRLVTAPAVIVVYTKPGDLTHRTRPCIQTTGVRLEHRSRSCDGESG
jgi:hypothetical protein